MLYHFSNFLALKKALKKEINIECIIIIHSILIMQVSSLTMNDNLVIIDIINKTFHFFFLISELIAIILNTTHFLYNN